MQAMLGEILVNFIVLCVIFLVVAIIVAIKNKWRKSEITSFDLIGKSKVNGLDMKTFDDIAGLSEVKTELRKIIRYFKSDKDKGDLKLPAGILLYGPPGCGKTSLAKAIATEAGVNFLCRNASDLVSDNFLGSSNIARLFAFARKVSPCIVFIDELDILGARFGATSQHQCDVTRLLAEMDGFQKNTDILVIGATNDVGALDKALLRSGRFGRKFHVGAPTTEEDVLQVIDMYSSGKVFEEKLTRNILARMFMGMSPADMEEVLNYCGVTSFLNDAPITREDIEVATIELNIGSVLEKKKSDVNSAYRKLRAYHEAGHAVVGKAVGMCISSVTIYGSSSIGVGGLTKFGADYDIQDLDAVTDLKTIKGVVKNLITLYGGYCAEREFARDMSDISLGSTHDINVATNIAEMIDMCFPWYRSIIRNSRNTDSQERLNAREEAIDLLCESACKQARLACERNKVVIARLASSLLDNYMITDDCLDEILKDVVSIDVSWEIHLT